jgi:arylsulfatase A-like enzyme
MKWMLLAWLGWTVVAEAAEPERKPNVLLILADDMGWSDLGCQGSEIATPQIDRLASEGLRFKQFYNAARCCPSRASLLTGLYPHQAGMGAMVVTKPESEPGPYQGYLSQDTATLAEVIKTAGYRCYMSGKWHVGEFRPNWPIDRGFDHAYGLISGAMNYYNINKGKTKKDERFFAEDDKPLQPSGPDFYATDAFTGVALRYLKDHRAQYASQPWFMYLAYTAPHYPLHAPETLVQKYLPLYQNGWRPVREARWKKLKELGLISQDTPLSPPDAEDWDKLSPEQKAEMSRKMAVYAAMIETMDADIGKIRTDLEKAGELDNTLILFLSDNGACAEGGILGKDFRPDLTGAVGTEDSYQSYGGSWSNVSNTPLRRHKAFTHEGGIRTPCIVRWPKGLTQKSGSMTNEVGHIIDIMPTLCEVTGAKYPDNKPKLPGKSILPALHGESLGARQLGWEHFGAAAWRDGDWKLVRPEEKAPWELYHISADASEMHDLIGQEKDRAANLQQAWEAWARQMGVRSPQRSRE